MARMYSRKKGKSGSKRPVKKTKPVWLRYGSRETEQLVIKLAKAGKTASEIGIILRDSYGIPSVSAVTKKKIMLVENNEILRKKFQDFIKDLNYDVTPYSSGMEKALRKF